MKKTLVMVVGAVFVLIGLLGFINNPIVGEHGLFETNMLHNLVHLLSGVLAFVLAAQGEKGATLFGKIMTVVYGLVTVLGLFMASPILGLVTINGADNLLHVALTLVFAYIGFAPTSKVAAAK